MKKNCAKLAIDSIRLSTNQQPRPMIIYRYFSCESDRDNFINGDIWFASPNQNRYYKNPNDPLEYFYDCGWTSSVIGIFSLSFQLHEPENLTEKAWVKIEDVYGFMNSIKEDIEKSQKQFCHQISWLDDTERSKLRCKAEKGDHQLLMCLQDRDFDPNKHENIKLSCCNIGGETIQYVDKSELISSSLEATGIAYGKSNKFKEENEWRITLHPSLKYKEFPYYYTKYIKLKCPSITKYCIPI